LEFFYCLYPAVHKEKIMFKRIAASAVAVALVGVGSVAAFAADSTAPTYLETVASGATLKVLTTVGDAPITGTYAIPGVPDGMGAETVGNSVNIYMNAEFPYNADTAKISRAGGAAFGATQSALTLDPASMTLTAGKELLSKVTFFNYLTGKHGSIGAPAGAPAADTYGTPNHNTFLARFCSASLAAKGAFAAKVGKTTYGYTGSVFLAGEESSDESRGFATNTATGELVQLPRLGLAGWETFNVVPTKNLVTAVIGNEDGADIDSQVYMYVGKKTTKGTWYEKAGLNNGKLYTAAIEGYSNDYKFREGVGKGKTAPVSFKNINWNMSGADQKAANLAWGTAFSRVEDGQFDPKNPNDYYFLTTQSAKFPASTTANPALPGVSRDGGALWRLRFNDVKNPLAGGTIEMLLDGSESIYLSKPDNLTVDTLGNILIQEDPGGNDAVARVVAYNVATKKIATVAKFKDEYFAKGGAKFITNDEESSGITDVTSLLKKSSSDTNSYYILNAQIHATVAKSRPDLTAVTQAMTDAYEGGQVYVLTIPDWTKVYN
jgi:hypothetical protein